MSLIRFHGELNDLIHRPMKHRAFGFRSAEHATLKHAIEAFGVPHTEVGRVLVDGAEAGLALLAGDAPDPLLAALADGDGRLLLSRDRELLEHRRVARGRYVRASRTEEQLREVVRHFGLWRLARRRDEPLADYISPPIGICGSAAAGCGLRATMQAVVRISPEIEAAFCSAVRVTLQGSSTPISTMSP